MAEKPKARKIFRTAFWVVALAAAGYFAWKLNAEINVIRDTLRMIN